MTLTPPAHICGSLGHLKGKNHPVIVDRQAWIIAAIKGGHQPAQIAAALGAQKKTVLNVVNGARHKGLLPKPVKHTAAAPKLGVMVAPGKSVVYFPGDNRVSVAAMPGEEAELAPDLRHETTPRFTLVRDQPRPERRADVAGAIAAIRKAWEARA